MCAWPLLLPCEVRLWLGCDRGELARLLEEGFLYSVPTRYGPQFRRDRVLPKPTRRRLRGVVEGWRRAAAGVPAQAGSDAARVGWLF